MIKRLLIKMLTLYRVRHVRIREAAHLRSIRRVLKRIRKRSRVKLSRNANRK